MKLGGVRIWLSGSIPESASEGEAERIRSFVRAFAAEVFRQGGRLVHGSHPSIRDELLREAAAYKEKTGRKAGLVLVVSRLYSKEPDKYGIDLAAWNDVCEERVVETREALAESTGAVPQISFDDSLAILRDSLVDQSNAVVAFGGKWWEVRADGGGVPQEVELAREKRLPLFLLGALGGSLRAYLEARPELLRQCDNGLTEAQNQELASLEDPADLARRICDQLSRLPLPSRSQSRSRPFRILCLDGGGICGAFTAAVLRRWEAMTNKLKVVDHFDMIAGTSTGGILAIGLGLGLEPAEMEAFYKNKGAEIFPIEGEIAKMTHSIRHWFRSKYDAGVLRRALVEAYGTARVKPPKDAYLTRLVVPVFNSETDFPEVYRAWPDSAKPPFRSFDGYDPVDIALATAAAPTYFDPSKIGYARVVDGGVWANSPTTIALAEAIHGMGIEPERIQLLSVGTTFDTRLLGRPAELDRKMIEALVRPATNGLVAKLVGLLWKDMPIHGKLGWLPNIAGFLMKTQSQTANYICERVLGDRFVRVDMATEPIELDAVEAINRLISLGEHAADKFLNEVSTRFLNGVPIDRP